MSLTPEELEGALTSVAVVRLTLRDLPSSQQAEDLAVLIGGLTKDEQYLLVWHVADLAGAILQQWHDAIEAIMPSDQKDLLSTPEEMLDQMIQVLLSEGGSETET